MLSTWYANRTVRIDTKYESRDLPRDYDCESTIDKWLGPVSYKRDVEHLECKFM